MKILVVVLLNDSTIMNQGTHYDCYYVWFKLEILKIFYNYIILKF